jgi:hypothetical protein
MPLFSEHGLNHIPRNKVWAMFRHLSPRRILSTCSHAIFVANTLDPVQACKPEIQFTPEPSPRTQESKRYQVKLTSVDHAANL